MKIKFVVLALLGWTILDGCDEKKDDATTPANTDDNNLTLSITGLTDLGSDYRYEGWVLDKDFNPTSTGVFTATDAGVLSKTSFKVDKAKLDAATSFAVSIEPNPDTDPKPATTKILAGSFSSNSAALSIGDDGALGTNFSTAKGIYFFETPSNGPGGADSLSGVWFATPAGPQAAPTAGLELPLLTEGWQYEGWAVVTDQPGNQAGKKFFLSTGTFTTAAGEDDSKMFQGADNTMPVPFFPGEDFLANPPAGLTFPLDLSGAAIVISVEPDPDNSDDPFLLKPLADMAPNPATRIPNTLTPAGDRNHPKGTATRK